MASRTVECRAITRHHSPFLILGDSASGKTNILKVIINQLGDRKLYVVDSASRKLFDIRERENVEYIAEESSLEQFALWLTQENGRRKAAYDEAVLLGQDFNTILESMEETYVLIDDLDHFCETVGQSMTVLAGRMKQAMGLGVTFIVTADSNKLKGTDDFTRMMKSTRNGLLTGSQAYLTVFPVKVGQVPKKPDGFLMLEGRGDYIRLPRAEKRGERE